MIIVRLMGGLGNQMFQYAAGKALAERLGVSLQLDRTFLDQRSENPGYTLRNFELDVFQISASTAEKSVVARMRKPLENSMHRKLSNMFPSLIRNHVFSETQKKLIKEFELLTDPVYMEGYWQTEKYFLSIADQLRSKVFIPVAAISSMNAELVKSIGSTSSVSMHVRRGDYVTNVQTNKYHGTCSVDYYQHSAKMIVEKTGADHFYVFSDEPEWVKANIVLPYATTYISHNIARESYWDIVLMQHCKHHIIANSSFSWWGAWLNESRSKIVIAPKTWFNDVYMNNQTENLIPTKWIRM